jgi:hypothetical protein
MVGAVLLGHRAGTLRSQADSPPVSAAEVRVPDAAGQEIRVFTDRNCAFPVNDVAHRRSGVRKTVHRRACGRKSGVQSATQMAPFGSITIGP